MTQTGCADKAPSGKGVTNDVVVPNEQAPPGPLEPIVQTSRSGLSATWIADGAHLQSVRLPDGTQVLAGFAAPRDYAGDHPGLGSLVGRRELSLPLAEQADPTGEAAPVSDDAPSGLSDRYRAAVWETDHDGETLIFRHTVPVGRPPDTGHLDLTIRTWLTDRELHVRLLAITDRPTPIALTQQGHWNVAGLSGVPIDELTLQSPTDQFLTDGETRPVENTPFDLRAARPVGTEPLDFDLVAPGEGIRPMVRLTDGLRTMTLLSDYPGVRIWTGEDLGRARRLSPRAALGLSPQYAPGEPGMILLPGEVYRHTIIYRFDGPGFAEDPRP